MRRAPTVAGVAGGVGTTTIARALAGSDRGVFTGRPVDVLVCRATADSLVRAARAAYLSYQAVQGGTSLCHCGRAAQPRQAIGQEGGDSATWYRS